MNTIPRPSLRGHAHLLRMASDISGTLEHLHETYGRIVDVGFRYPMRLLYLFGPEANRYLLSENPSNFSWKDQYQLVEVLSGPNFMLVSDGSEHERRRRQVQPAFSKRRIDGHIELAVAEIDSMLATWSVGRTLDAYIDLRSTVRRISLQALFGQHLGDRAEQIGQLLDPTVRHMGLSPITRRDVNLPGTSYRRALQGRAAADVLIQEEIDRRRADGSTSGSIDALGSILESVGDCDGGNDIDGEAPLSDEEIRDQVRGLIAAGYDTTSSAAAWLVYALGRNPAAFDRLKEQVRDVLGDRPPTIEDLRGLDTVDAVVRETLRLWPPAAVGLRKSVGPFEIFGHRIAEATNIVYSPYITHRLPEVWDDAESFRIERWRDGEPEPGSYVPFGGGSRKCLGFALATLELQVLAIRLAQFGGWSIQREQVRPSGFANFAPDGGMPILIT